jgi:hypothetical protein
VLLCLAGLAVLPAAASADYTCTSVSGRIAIAMREVRPGGDFAPTGPSIVANADGSIFTAACPGGATVFNTNSFEITDAVPSLTRRVSIQAIDIPFAPGAPLEPDGTSEIEFDIDLGPESPAPDTVDLRLPPSDDNIEIGTTRGSDLTLANLNAGAEPADHSDADVRIDGLHDFANDGSDLRGHEFVAVFDQGGDDRFSADGGPALPLPAATSVTLQGYSGNDQLIGGRRGDELEGASGDDDLKGMDGNDLLTGDTGRDRLKGGSGKDRLKGGDGSDRIVGNGGKDRFDGGPSGDFIKSRDGRSESVACGPGRFEVRADDEDRVARDCERIL